MDRRLAVIIAIDVVDYSRSLQENGDMMITALNAILRDVVRTAMSENRGEIVKLTGDGAIGRFASARDAILCAAMIQRRMAGRPPDSGLQHPVRLRIGLHAGDVWTTGTDVFGDAVNIAARLEAAARPGNVLLSGLVAALAGPDLPATLKSEGTHSFKGIRSPVETLSIDLDDDSVQVRRARAIANQQVRFCRSRDGTALAWAELGEGTPVIRAPAWISHLELDWQAPMMAHWIGAISDRHRLVRFDARGNGLSDWEIGVITFDHAVDDLVAVFDAAGVERGHVLAFSQGGAVAAAFAARHPERVASIAMLGTYPQGRSKRADRHEQVRAHALQAMMAAGWDDDGPSLRSLMADLICPLASEEDRARFAENMRDTTTAANMAAYRGMLDDLDVTGLLGSVAAPCLVMHLRHDRMQPIAQGRRMAAGLPLSRFVAYDSVNHIPTENDPCWPSIRSDVLAFFAEVDAHPA